MSKNNQTSKIEEQNKKFISILYYTLKLNEIKKKKFDKVITYLLEKISHSFGCNHDDDIISFLKNKLFYYEDKLDVKNKNFINKSREIHGLKYNYCNVNYIIAKTHVNIICVYHGEFPQTPDNHLRKRGCPKCKYRDRKPGQYKKSNTEDFKEKSKMVHGDNYDYSKVDYKRVDESVIIICRIHGEFPQKPSIHLGGSGCTKCGYELVSNKLTMEQEDFIKKCKEIHDDKYDYSKVIYKNSKEKVIIICKKHNWEFEQEAHGHLCGNGCSKCSGNYKKSTDEWIIEAKKIHGDKYDYSNSIFTKSDDRIIICCKVHGIFTQRAISHLIGYGCTDCGRDITALKRNIGQEKFIERCAIIHGDKYDYSKVLYKNCKEKVIIICKKHNWEFEQSAGCHLQGQGCRKCSENYTYSVDEFIEKCKEIHDDKYDYSKVKYERLYNYIIITCKKHNWEFEQSASNHLRGQGCAKCGNSYNYTTDEWVFKVNEVHDYKYDYSNVKYSRSCEKVNIICNIHGEFLQEANSHLQGQGCSKCSGNYSYNTEEFIEKCNIIHGDKYEYSKTTYISTDVKVEIICVKHGSFFQTPHHHLRGIGCPTCKNKTEAKFYEYAIKVYEIQHNIRFEWCKNNFTNYYLPFDFVLFNFRIIIEIDGPQHFQEVSFFNNDVENNIKRDIYKMVKAVENKYSVIRLYQEDVWNDKNNWKEWLNEKIEFILKNQDKCWVFFPEKEEYDKHIEYYYNQHF
jgi:very-short-patch-repair endonuclease